MKAKVIIENGKTSVILTPENDFEIDIIEKVYNNSSKNRISTKFNLTTQWSINANHNITLNINETNGDLPPCKPL